MSVDEKVSLLAATSPRDSASPQSAAGDVLHGSARLPSGTSVQRSGVAISKGSSVTSSPPVRNRWTSEQVPPLVRGLVSPPLTSRQTHPIRVGASGGAGLTSRQTHPTGVGASGGAGSSQGQKHRVPHDHDRPQRPRPTRSQPQTMQQLAAQHAQQVLRGPGKGQAAQAKQGPLLITAFRPSLQRKKQPAQPVPHSPRQQSPRPLQQLRKDSVKKPQTAASPQLQTHAQAPRKQQVVVISLDPSVTHEPVSQIRQVPPQQRVSVGPENHGSTAFGLSQLAQLSPRNNLEVRRFTSGNMSDLQAPSMPTSPGTGERPVRLISYQLSSGAVTPTAPVYCQNLSPVPVHSRSSTPAAGPQLRRHNSGSHLGPVAVATLQSPRPLSASRPVQATAEVPLNRPPDVVLPPWPAMSAWTTYQPDVEPGRKEQGGSLTARAPGDGSPIVGVPNLVSGVSTAPVRMVSADMQALLTPGGPRPASLGLPPGAMQPPSRNLQTSISFPSSVLPGPFPQTPRDNLPTSLSFHSQQLGTPGWVTPTSQASSAAPLFQIDLSQRSVLEVHSGQRAMSPSAQVGQLTQRAQQLPQFGRPEAAPASASSRSERPATEASSKVFPGVGRSSASVEDEESSEGDQEEEEDLSPRRQALARQREDGKMPTAERLELYGKLGGVVGL
eukprot:TRINITY_DN11997_c0_g1_i2.p1 TRINITY_DN11997_c0_g1~~TRINITY_DN11997_c0_g1_i2.p1  ORF type:complete len:668 (+),score=92.03 TRINITY_DN11997_c0_g1_i2:84-2087(+)